MAMPKVLDWLDELVAKVATNTANIAQNTSDIAANKALFDTHVADDERHWTTEDRQNFDRVVHFKGYYTSIEKLQEAYPTGQLGDYAIVGGTDTVWLWDDESNSWLNSTEQGIVISVNGRTGEVVLTKTDVGLSNVDNTADKDKPISTAQQTALDAKADRKKVTLAQAESLTLRSGIYYIDNEQKTIRDFTSNYWTIIVAERSTSTNASATQIWMNYNSNVTQHIYMRKQQSGSSWSEFREIMTDVHYSELDTRIQENTENITQNTTDIENLDDNKADRKLTTIEEANGFLLNSGIYYILNEEYTIHQTTSTHWTIIVGSRTGDGNKSASQIWIPIHTNTPTTIFLRHQLESASSWTDFVEILTTDIATREDINRFKQYKGYYALLSDLRTDFPTATDGDYAIVGSALYIWNSKSSSWNEVSGSGGSTGTGKWSAKSYDASAWDSAVKYIKDIQGLSLEKQWEIEDTADNLLNETLTGNEKKGIVLETFVNMQTDTTISTTTMQHSNGVSIYINENIVFEQNDTAENQSLSLNLVQGWNKIQIVLKAQNGEGIFKLGTMISNNVNALSIDCYHNYDTIIDNRYVPYIGDSTIDGHLTVNGTVGITENSYLQFNVSDNSLSFMFSNQIKE